jgi:hypothetical protein
MMNSLMNLLKKHLIGIVTKKASNKNLILNTLGNIFHKFYFVSINTK